MSKLRKILTILGVSLALIGTSPLNSIQAVPLNREVMVFIDNNKLECPEGILMEKGNILVPFRELLTYLKVPYVWDGSTKSITITKENKIIILKVDKLYAVVNGVNVTLTVPAQIYNGKTYVPLRFVSECLDMDVEWNGSNKRVDIQSQAQVLYYDSGEKLYYGDLNEDGKQDGYGKEYAKSGALIYEGQWKDGVKEGKGKFTWENLDIYEGEVKNNAQHGQGKMTFYGIGIYTGNFIEGKRNGQGSFKWENGDMYSGQWEDDQMEGKGIYTFATGICYEGTFKDNEMITVIRKYKI